MGISLFFSIYIKFIVYFLDFEDLSADLEEEDTEEEEDEDELFPFFSFFSFFSFVARFCNVSISVTMLLQSLSKAFFGNPFPPWKK